MQVATGSYTGNGSDNRGITGVGFQPDVVMVKRSALSGGLALRTSTMAADKTASTGFALYADGIQSLDADGFTLGTDSYENASGSTYWYMAIKAAAADCKVGTYTGNGVDDRDITGVGFLPAFVLIIPDSSSNWAFSSSEHSAGTSQLVFGTAAPAANLIQSLGADGFQVGTHASVNANGVTYHYIAFKSVAGFLKVGSYTGNGSDNRSISGVGFEPIFVHAMADSGFNANINYGAMGDSTGGYAGSSHAADYIQAFEADGFQVGTANGINQNTTTFRYLAIKSGNSAAASGQPSGSRHRGIPGMNNRPRFGRGW